MLIHVTTTDMSLDVLLGPQLAAFAAAGYDVVGAAAPGQHEDRIAAWGATFVPLVHATRAMAPHRDLRALAELRALFRRMRPTIVHTHNPKPGVYGRLAARAARVPIVVNTVHGLYAQPEDRLPRRAVVYGLERLAALCSDAELVQNPEDVETLARIGVPRSKLHLLGNGIDLDRFDPERVSPHARSSQRRQLGLSDDDVVCGLVGRLVRDKGYPEVFEAARLLRGAVPGLRFVVVGPREPDKADAVSEAEIERAAAELGVVFLGLRHDVEALYPVMDMFVLASHREGYPRTPMEAAAMGLPVIATDIRGCRQVVDDGATGLLVPAGDAVGLARAIRRLAENRSLRVRFGRAARAKAKTDFDQQRVIELTLSVYEHLRARGA